MRRLYLPAMFCLLLSSGCGSREEVPTLNDELIRHLSDLPGARQSPHVALREEIARLEMESATPALLAADASDEPTANEFFLSLFHANNLLESERASGEIIPRPTFQIGPIELERIHRFGQQYQTQHERVRRWTSETPAPFGIDPRQGWFIETNFIAAATISIRLEMLAALEQFAAGNLEEAANAWTAAMSLCEQLAATPLVNARLTAVHVRADLLQLLAAMVQSPQATAEFTIKLASHLQGTLERWPTEADLWRTDRAVGLHAYELIRAGHLLHVLTPEEVQRFADEQILRELEAAAQRSLDSDQLFYLRSMRKIVDSCRPGPDGNEPPYFARADEIREILEALSAKRSESDYPLIAARLLLPDVQPTQQWLAVDRARCEAWLLALSRATGSSPPSCQVSPATGQPYQLSVEQHRVVIRGFVGNDLEAELPVIVPRFDVRVSQLP